MIRRLLPCGLAALLLFASRGDAVIVCTPLGTTTPVLSLCKPAVGETGWAASLNNNMTVIDALFTGSSLMKPLNGGTGVDGSAAGSGTLLIGNGTGYTLAALTGTTNQITVTNGAGTITLAAPQNLHTGATPRFSALGLGVAAGSAGTLSLTGKIPRYNNATLTDGQLLIGNSATGTFDAATLTAGSGISVTNSGGSITIATATPTILSGTTTPIGGSPLVQGACTSGVASVSLATTAMVVVATPATYPGDGIVWHGWVSASGTVTVSVCSMAAFLVPKVASYNVRVIQ